MSITDNIFSSDRVNTGRQKELDLLKAFTVIVMLINHVHFILLMGSDVPVFSFVSEVIRKLISAAPFMFCMGMTFFYTMNDTWKDNIRRGISLMSFCFGLHIFFFPVCTWFTYQFTHDSFDLMLLLGTYGSDILHFAGLTFLLIGLLKATGNFSSAKVLIVGILLSIVGTFVNNLNVDNIFLNHTIGFFVGNDDTHFPFVNWFIYVAFGIAYGDLYTHLKNKTAYHNIVLPVTLLLCVIFLYISFNVPNPFLIKFAHDEFYLYRVGIFDALVNILIVVCGISLLFKLAPKMPVGIIGNFSKYLINYYIISWMIIELEVCGMKLLGIYADFPKTLTSGLLLLALTTALTHWCVMLYVRHFKEKIGWVFTTPAYMVSVWVIAIAFELYIIDYINKAM